ncbi:uncharacterized protein LOC144431019 [Styela clava]
MRGGRIPKHDYVPESHNQQKYLQRERKRGIRKETQLGELFNNFKQGHVCFVGPPGSGKTTLMKATSRDVMQGKYFQGNIKMVPYVECKQFMNDSKVTAEELIFNNLTKEERDQAIYIAKTHPEEVLFMLDSLDTLQYTVDGVYEVISLDEPAYPEIDWLDLGEYLGENRIANHEDIVAVANLLPNVKKRLDLVGWEMADEDKEILQNKLDEIRSEELEIQFGPFEKLKSQSNSADATTNVFSKQLPTTTSKAEFGSPYDSFENTGENVETLQEVGSPRSELPLSEEEAEQSDKEVTEELAKPTQHSDTSSRTTGEKRRRTSDGEGGSRSKIPTTELEDIQQEDELSLYALPQIENVSSQRSGSDILLTWNEVTDRNVLYNIEIFCDDVKLGETHTTEVPQYRMKSPTLGKKYRFQVWANDEWGNSGIKTQSKNVIKFVNVEVAGGSIRLNECKVTFPEETFNKQTKVWMSVVIDNSLCPEEYIGITPNFDISADSEFLRDVIVQIKSWCVGLEKDKIDILHFSSKTDWDIIKPDRITENNSIEFRCRKFSLFTVAMNWLKWLIGKQEVIVDNCLYIHNKKKFHFTFFEKSETAETNIRSHYRELGARLAPIWFNPFALKTGDRLCLELQIDQEDLQFNMPHGQFICDRIFLTSQRHKLTFHLLPNLQEYPERLIICRVLKNDVLHEMQDFDFPLAPLEGGGPPPVNFAGAHIGNLHLPENHNNQQIGQNEQEEAGAVGGNQAME